MPHIQKVVDFGDSVQIQFRHTIHHIWVIFWVHCVWYTVITCQNPNIPSNTQPYNYIFATGLVCGFWLPPAKNILPKGETGLHSDTMCYDRKYIVCHIGAICILWVHFLFPLTPVCYIQYPKSTANLHWVGVEIIGIWINLPPVLWCLKQRIEIEPGGSQ